MYSLSDQVRSVWAKSPDKDGEWLPLHQHLLDAAAMAGWLWDHWQADQTKASLAQDLGVSQDDARSVAVYLAGIHDIGKATPIFAAMSHELFGKNVEAGLESGGRGLGGRGDHHSRTGYAATLTELTDRGASRFDAKTWAIVVGSHHGDPPSLDQVNGLRPGRKSPMGGPAWKSVRDLLLAEHWESSGLVDVIARRGWFALPQTAQVVLTGLVIVADWLASNEELFGYTDLDAPDRLEQAVTKIGLPGPWTPAALPDQPEDLYQQRFGSVESLFTPRPVQAAVAQVTAAMPGPGLLIVEAPMGEGKTEAALVAVEIFASLFGSGGIHLALPTQATADGMFDRVVRWVDRLPTDDLPIGASIWLGHGKAGLNDSWSRLSSGVRGVDPESKGRAGPHSWMVGRKKAHLATVAVSTVDHLLFAGLRARHLMLRHLALAGKSVVVDEVHAYDAWMSGYLDRVLSWLGAYRVPVVLLSATLPPTRRSELVAAYTGQPVQSSVAENTGYPLITAAAGDWCEQMEPARSSRGARVAVNFIGDDLQTAAQSIEDAVNDGGCVLAIRNTVGRAQDMYAEMVRRLGPDRVTLNHSRFIAVDRADLDKSLLNRFGPPDHLTEVGGSRPDGHVVVATQVAEQSLDVDFDLLLTDIAPVDLVLQRMGRLHRHVRPRPTSLVDPRCLITGIELHGDDVPPEMESGAGLIYGPWTVLRAAHVLADRTTVSLPDDIATLVREAYDGVDTRPGWQAAQDEALTKAKKEREEKERGAKTFQVGAPNGCEPILGWVDGSAIDDDSKGSAEVRDTEDMLEVTVMVRGNDGRLRLPHWSGGLARSGSVIDSDRPIEKWLFRDVEGCSLRLPKGISHAGAAMELWDATPPAWEEGTVGSSRPLLALDKDLTTTVCGRELTYDPLLGLSVS